MPCSYVWFDCVPAVVGVSRRRVKVVGGIDVLVVYSSASWRLVIRGASYMAALVVCMEPLRPFGGGCKQASRKRGRRHWFVLGSTDGRSWRIVTRGAACLAALLVCMVPLCPFAW